MRGDFHICLVRQKLDFKVCLAENRGFIQDETLFTEGFKCVFPHMNQTEFWRNIDEA